MSDRTHQALGILGLIVCAPALITLALLVRLDSRGPALYRAVRVGRGGRPFACLKFRTMTWQASGPGPAITVEHDRRITRLGRFLRGARIDELPQLINVARGEMNLIGPRPEDPRFVDQADPLHRVVFTAKPGITGLTQLSHVNEAAMLRDAGADPESYYRTVLLPRKVALDAMYLERRSWRLDLWILWRTVLVLAGRRVDLPDLEHVK